MSLDFTLEKYNELCQAIQQLGCPVMTIRDFLLAGQAQEQQKQLIVICGKQMKQYSYLEEIM